VPALGVLPVEVEDGLPDVGAHRLDESVSFFLDGVRAVPGEVVKAQKLSAREHLVRVLTEERVNIAASLCCLDEDEVRASRGDIDAALVHGDIDARQACRAPRGRGRGLRRGPADTGVAQAGRPGRGPGERVIAVSYRAGLATSAVSSRTVSAVGAKNVTRRIDPELREKRIVRLLAGHHDDVPRRREQVTDAETPGGGATSPGVTNVGEPPGGRLAGKRTCPGGPGEQRRAHTLVVESDVKGPGDSCRAIGLTGAVEPAVPVAGVIRRPSIRLRVSDASECVGIAPVAHLGGRITGHAHGQSPPQELGFFFSESII